MEDDRHGRGWFESIRERGRYLSFTSLSKEGREEKDFPLASLGEFKIP